MINFIYLAHGQDRYRKQAVFSILSLLSYLRNGALPHRVVVYTDMPELYDPIGVVTRKVDEEKLNKWKGDINFVHRAKICVMQQAALDFDGRLFFLDSDNYVFADPVDMLGDWTDDTVILEKLEYRLDAPADLLGRKYKRFFHQNGWVKGKGAKGKVLPDQPCWNSGIVGLAPAAIKLLPDVLALCDEMHRQLPKHLSEQMAFSIVLGSAFTIRSFDQYTYHWFGHGQAVNTILAEVLRDYPDTDLPTLITATASVKQLVLDAPLNPDKLPWYRRMLSIFSRS